MTDINNVWKFGTSDQHWVLNRATGQINLQNNPDKTEEKSLFPKAILSALNRDSVALQYQIGNEFKITDPESDLSLTGDQNKEFNDILDHKNDYVNSKRYQSNGGDNYKDNVTGEEFNKNDLTYERKVQIITEARVDRGRYTLSPGGQIVDTQPHPDVILKQGEVGFQLKTHVIDRLQDEIGQINDVITRLTQLNAWVTAQRIADTEYNRDQVWHVNTSKADSDNKAHEHGNDGTEGQYREYFTKQGFSGSEINNFLRDTNNEYVKWIGKSGGVGGDFKAFGEGRITGSKFRIMSTTFQDATERMRNLVKEKSTQAEQLSTDFQTRNSRYNAVIEAMTNYSKTYYGAIKAFTN